jgi:hypothetical protein
MKTQQMIAVAILVLASFGAVASIVILPGQLGKQKSVPPVVIGSAGVAQTNALLEITRTLPAEMRSSVLQTHGFASVSALEQNLQAQRAELTRAEQTRSAEIQRTENATLVLLALAVFAFFATACGAVMLFDASRPSARTT